MGWRRIAGKLLLVVAGGCGLVLLMFVGLPLLTQMLEPQESLAPEEIVAEVLGVPAAEEGDEAVADGGAEGGGMLAPSPVVAVRNNGEEIAVLFPAPGGEEPQNETPGTGDRPADEERAVAQGSTLPPVLSPEEVAEAMAGLEAGSEGAGEPVGVDQGMHESSGEAEGPDTEGVVPGERLESSTETAEGRSGIIQRDTRRPEVVLLTNAGDARHVEATPAPASATRDVQELLAALGYAPGPLDGIWGERTAAAWRNYARDAVERATRAKPARSQTGRVVDPPVAESPTPSGATVEAEDDGAGQAGETRPLTGLPPQPVVVPGTLRGVMGYRMPLVSRQGVPDQVVSGVLIPAHTTFVILKPGYWELVGLEPGELERLQDASAQRESEPPAEAVKSGWNPLRRRKEFRP